MTDNPTLSYQELRDILRRYVRFGASMYYRYMATDGQVVQGDDGDMTADDFVPVELLMAFEALLGRQGYLPAPIAQQMLMLHQRLAAQASQLSEENARAAEDHIQKLREAQPREQKKLSADFSFLPDAVRQVLAAQEAIRQSFVTHIMNLLKEKQEQEERDSEDGSTRSDKYEQGDADEDSDEAKKDDNQGGSGGQSSDEKEDEDGEGDQGDGQGQDGEDQQDGEGEGSEGQEGQEGNQGQGQQSGNSQSQGQQGSQQGKPNGKPGEQSGQQQGSPQQNGKPQNGQNYDDDKSSPEDQQEGYDKYMDDLQKEQAKREAERKQAEKNAQQKAEEDAKKRREEANDAEKNKDGNGKGGKQGQSGKTGKDSSGVEGSDPNRGKGVEGSYDLSNLIPDMEDVRACKGALSSLIGRGRNNPVSMPRYNKANLIKRAISGRNIKMAMEPTQERKALLFIIDNSPSMSHLEAVSRALAAALSRVGAPGGADVVVVLSCNGEYGTTTPPTAAKQDGCWWLNGKFQGPLPDPSAVIGEARAKSHGERWKWFLTKFLPGKNVRIKLAGIYGDYDGTRQWCYISHKLTGITNVWFNPPANPSDTGPVEEAREIERRTWGTSDTAYAEGDATFETYRGRMFLRVNSVADIARALRKVAGLA